MADATTFVSRLTNDDSPAEVHRRQRREAISRCSEAWSEATRMQKFANGDQWPEGDKRNLDKPQRKVARVTFDRIGPIIQMFSGRQIMQRFERVYIARHPSASRQAEVMTAVDQAMMHAAGAERIESQAFKDGPGIQGISATRWELDSLGERGGGLLLSDAPIWNVMWDPEARDANLEDRSWHCYGKWYPQGEVRRRWPEKYEFIKSRHGGGEYAGSAGGANTPDGGQSSRIPWAGMAGNRPLEPYYATGQTLWVEFKEWREVESRWDVAVPADPTLTYEAAASTAADLASQYPDGIPDELDPYRTQTFTSRAQLTDFKDERLAVFGEPVPDEVIAERQELVYKYAYVCGDVELETGVCPTGYWTIQFLCGFRFPLANKVTWRSLVSRLVDPQKWVNVIASAMIRNWQINPKGTLAIEEGAFKSRDDAMAAWASPGSVLWVKRGTLTGGGQKPFEWIQGGTSGYSQMLDGMLQLWRDAIPELAGFNPGALGQLGSDLRRISGEVVRQVQDAAMTSNAEPFDNLRLYRREGGRIFLSFLRRFFKVEDLIRIVGEDVAYEPVMQPAINPVTGQPALDPLTGEQLMEPAIGPDGAPQRRLVLPGPEAWRTDYWKDISTEDRVPAPDSQQLFWKATETSMPIMLQPQPDTGMPVFSSEDIVEMVPNLPSQRREKMLQRIKAMTLMKARQEWAAQQGAGGEAGAGGEGGGAPQPVQ